jgi:hypothetical protein
LTAVEFAGWVEASVFGHWVRGSGTVYPVANIIHLFGLVALIGGIGVVDLRLLGVFRRLPLKVLSAALTPVGVGGLVLLALSGPVLFAADARALINSNVFLWKLSLIVIAIFNALLFRRLWRKRRSERVTPTMRMLGGLSIGLWLTIMVLGRLIAYR